MRLIHAFAAFIVLTPVASAAGQAKICAQAVAPGSDDYRQEYEYGPIVVPEHAVFEWAGHSFGGPEDRRDMQHMASDPTSERTWPSIPLSEEQRRHRVTMQDTAQGHPATAVITLEPAKLTYSHPCAFVPVSLFVTKDWGEAGTPVKADNVIVYQADGVWRDDHILTEEGAPHPFAANVQSGNINAAITQDVTGYFLAYKAP